MPLNSCFRKLGYMAIKYNHNAPDNPGGVNPYFETVFAAFMARMFSGQCWEFD